MGHEVGIVCDAHAAGQNAETALRNLAENFCSLGVTRIAMSRLPGPRDILAIRAIRRIAHETGAQVLHGHGAKGGAYARIAASALKRKGQTIRAFYTPHGGSLHYNPESLQGRVYMGLERWLGRKTDGLVFESIYSSDLYHSNVGPFPCEMRVIHNGLRPEEFYNVVLDENAGEFVFIGELRKLKGVDVFLDALAEIRKTRDVRAFIAGGGPDAARFQKQARKLKLDGAVTFAGPTPARAAFSRGRCLVVPSRAESLPYIILEAAAACLPFIATRVGGIPEIVEGSDVVLVPADDADALAAEMTSFLDNPETYVDRASALQEIISRRFTIENMARMITHFYVSRLLEQNEG